MQTITGNNYGAAQWQRSNNSLVFAGVAAFCYCTILQILITVYAADIGQIFVDDPVVVAEVARILPVIVKVYFFSGPLMMVAAYFQAIGHAGHAAILSLARPFLFAIPLTFILSATLGEIGIWIAGPAAGLMMLALTIAVLTYTAFRGSLRWGLFHRISEEKS